MWGKRTAVLAMVLATTLGGAGLAPSGAAADPTDPLVPVAEAKPPKPPKPVVSKVKPASGPTAGGTTVKVKGEHLTGAKKVLFGKAKGTKLVVKSDKKLTVVAPKHAAGPVPVRVVTQGGKSKKSVTFTYVAPIPAPTVTGVAPGAGPVTGGSVVTVTGTNLTGATSVTFGGTPGTSLSAVTATSLKVTTPPHAAGNVDVRVTTPQGTSPVGGAARYRFEVAAAVALLPTGLSYYSGDTGAFTPIPGADVPANIQSYDLDSLGRVYFDEGTNGGLSQWDPATGQTQSVNALDVTALRAAGGGLVYYAVPTGSAAVTGTYVFDPKLGSSTRFDTAIATSIVAVDNGLAYVQNPSGLYLYDPTTTALTLVTAAAVGAFDAAGDGSVVFGTVAGVLTRFQRNGVGGFSSTPVPFTGDPASPNVVSFSVSESGFMYIDLSVNGTWLYSPATQAAAKIDTRNPVFLAPDRAGNAYVDYAGNGGTVRYNLAAAAFATLSANPNAFFGPDDVDTAGALYLDYNADGLYRFNPATSPLSQPFGGGQISTANPTSTVGNR